MSHPDFPEHGFQDERGRLSQPKRQSEPDDEVEAVSSAPERSTALFGKTVFQGHRFVIHVVVLALLAAACAGMGFFHLGWLHWGATGFGSLALMFLLGFIFRQHYCFSEEGINLGPREENFLAYREILEVFVAPSDRGRRRFPIHLLTADGFATLPANLSLPSEELYEFLITQPHGTRELGE